MKNLLFTTILLALLITRPLPARAEVNVHVGIPPPPAIVFPVPPPLVVIPETNVYAAPDVREDVFFYRGWWWRPWNGHWYRSRNYNSGWVHCHKVPRFYSGIPSTWRDDYRRHRWKGHRWNHHHVSQKQLQHNWRTWEKNGHWEKQNNWGVRDLSSRPHILDARRSHKFEPQRPGHQFREREGYGDHRDGAGHGHPSRDFAQGNQNHNFRR